MALFIDVANSFLAWFLLIFIPYNFYFIHVLLPESVSSKFCPYFHNSYSRGVTLDPDNYSI